jgi:hypothetical protein
VARASGPRADDMSAEMKRGEVLRPQRRGQQNLDCDRRLKPDRLVVARRL